MKKICTYKKYDNDKITDSKINKWKESVATQLSIELNKKIEVEDIEFESGLIDDDFIRNKTTFIGFVYLDENKNIIKQ